MRLFLAFPLPTSCQVALTALEERLHGARWIPAEQRHLTLRFIGEWDDHRTTELIDALVRVQIEPFLLPLAGVGAFPPHGITRVLWAGVGAAHSRLFQLRQRVDDTLLSLGWRGDVTLFSPHITVARVQDTPPASVSQWLRRHREYLGPSFQVKSFDLIRSDLGLEGAAHTVLHSFSLHPAPSQ